MPPACSQAQANYVSSLHHGLLVCHGRRFFPLSLLQKLLARTPMEIPPSLMLTVFPNVSSDLRDSNPHAEKSPYGGGGGRLFHFEAKPPVSRQLPHLRSPIDTPVLSYSTLSVPSTQNKGKRGSAQGMLQPTWLCHCLPCVPMGLAFLAPPHMGRGTRGTASHEFSTVCVGMEIGNKGWLE